MPECLTFGQRCLLGTITFLALASLYVGTAKAEEQPRTCLPYKTVQQANLHDHFREMSGGVDASEAAVWTVFVNAKDEYNMWAVGTTGMACLMSHGTGFFAIGTGRIS